MKATYKFLIAISIFGLTLGVTSIAAAQEIEGEPIYVTARTLSPITTNFFGGSSSAGTVTPNYDAYQEPQGEEESVYTIEVTANRARDTLISNFLGQEFSTTAAFEYEFSLLHGSLDGGTFPQQYSDVIEYKVREVEGHLGRDRHTDYVREIGASQSISQTYDYDYDIR